MRRFFYEAPAEIMRNYTTFFVSWKEISYKNEDEGFLVALT
jgi:hypothetical protein